jgi:hypothetical protein
MKADTKIDKLNKLINLRGQREQAFKFSTGFKGGMKQCYTKGCEIFTPLTFSLKGTNLSDVLVFDRMMNGEEKAASWLW